LWKETKVVFRLAPPCAADQAGIEKPSAACEEFLATNDRARMQWKLEAEFEKFEKKILANLNN
jgi:hypothetical protein